MLRHVVTHVKVWRRHCIAEAYRNSASGWYEQHVNLVRLRILSTLILKWWRHGASVVAWMTWYEE